MILKVLKRFLLATVLILALYFTVPFILMFFPSHPTMQEGEKDRTIHILYDVVHSGIAIDLKDINQTKWSQIFPVIQHRKEGYLLFGWGDKETYINTPNLKDLKVSTALKALFYPTESVVHIRYYPKISRFKDKKSIQITHEQLLKLEKNILKSFSSTEKKYIGYGRYDLFYDSPYHYTCLNTCNTWTGRELREVNISVSYWTPLTTHVVNSLP